VQNIIVLKASHAGFNPLMATKVCFLVSMQTIAQSYSQLNNYRIFVVFLLCPARSEISTTNLPLAGKLKADF